MIELRFFLYNCIYRAWHTKERLKKGLLKKTKRMHSKFFNSRINSISMIKPVFFIFVSMFLCKTKLKCAIQLKYRNSILFYILILYPYQLYKIFSGHLLLLDTSAVSAKLLFPLQERYSKLYRRCSIKKVFLNISQNSLEKTCVRVSFLQSCRRETCNFITKKIPTHSNFEKF